MAASAATITKRLESGDSKASITLSDQEPRLGHPAARLMELSQCEDGMKRLVAYGFGIVTVWDLPRRAAPSDGFPIDCLPRRAYFLLTPQSGELTMQCCVLSRGRIAVWFGYRDREQLAADVLPALREEAEKRAAG